MLSTWIDEVVDSVLDLGRLARSGRFWFVVGLAGLFFAGKFAIDKSGSVYAPDMLPKIVSHAPEPASMPASAASSRARPSVALPIVAAHAPTELPVRPSVSTREPRGQVAVAAVPARSAEAVPVPQALVQAPLAQVRSRVVAVSTDSDVDGLAGRAAAKLSANPDVRAALERQGVTMTIGFVEDLQRRNARENRVFGNWVVGVAGRPNCVSAFPAQWFGTGGYAELSVSQDETVAAGVAAISDFVGARLETLLVSCA